MTDWMVVFGAYALGFVFGACVTALMRGNDERSTD
jgi:hypothetical protein